MGSTLGSMIDPTLEAKAAQIRSAVERAEQQRADALRQRRQFILEMHENGYSYRETAPMLGIDPSRAFRSVKGNKPTTRRPRMKPVDL